MPPRHGSLQCRTVTCLLPQCPSLFHLFWIINSCESSATRWYSRRCSLQITPIGAMYAAKRVVSVCITVAKPKIQRIVWSQPTPSSSTTSPQPLLQNPVGAPHQPQPVPSMSHQTSPQFQSQQQQQQRQQKIVKRGASHFMPRGQQQGYQRPQHHHPGGQQPIQRGVSQQQRPGRNRGRGGRPWQHNAGTRGMPGGSHFRQHPFQWSTEANIQHKLMSWHWLYLCDHRVCIYNRKWQRQDTTMQWLFMRHFPTDRISVLE